jgi:hypothetical protein
MRWAGRQEQPRIGDVEVAGPQGTDDVQPVGFSLSISEVVACSLPFDMYVMPTVTECVVILRHVYTAPDLYTVKAEGNEQKEEEEETKSIVTYSDRRAIETTLLLLAVQHFPVVTNGIRT